MNCAECKAMHEQYKGYKGRWLCWNQGPTMGRVICETPIKDYGNARAHERALKKVQTPKWCPLKEAEP